MVWLYYADKKNAPVEGYNYYFGCIDGKRPHNVPLLASDGRYGLWTKMNVQDLGRYRPTDRDIFRGIFKGLID